MRNLLASLALLGCAVVLLGTAVAQDTKDDPKEKPKEVTLKGKITCGKCDLGTDEECATVIVVKGEKEKKDVVYYFDKAGHKKYHGPVCSNAKPGAVTGVVSKDGKKNIIMVKTLKFDE